MATRHSNSDSFVSHKRIDTDFLPPLIRSPVPFLWILLASGGDGTYHGRNLVSLAGGVDGSPRFVHYYEYPLLMKGEWPMKRTIWMLAALVLMTGGVGRCEPTSSSTAASSPRE